MGRAHLETRLSPESSLNPVDQSCTCARVSSGRARKEERKRRRGSGGGKISQGWGWSFWKKEAKAKHAAGGAGGRRHLQHSRRWMTGARRRGGGEGGGGGGDRGGGRGRWGGGGGGGRFSRSMPFENLARALKLSASDIDAEIEQEMLLMLQTLHSSYHDNGSQV